MSYPQLQNLTTVAASVLDNNWLAVGRNALIPCTISGTNAITMTPTPSSTTPSILAYANYMTLVGVAGGANTTSVTIATGALAALNAYVDGVGGPVQVPAGYLQQNNAFMAQYDSALGSGAGGFHLLSAPLSSRGGSISSVAIGSAAFIVRAPSSQISIVWSQVLGNTEGRVTVALTGARFLDHVMVGAPSTVSTGIMYDGFVAAADLVVVRALNVTLASVTPSSGMFRISTMGWG